MLTPSIIPCLLAVHLMDPSEPPAPSLEPLLISNAIAGAVYLALIPLMLWFFVDRPEEHTRGGGFLFDLGLTYALLSALASSALALTLTWATVTFGGVRKVPPAGIHSGVLFALGGLGWTLMAASGAELIPVKDLMLVGASIGIGCVFTGLIWFPLHVVVSIARSVVRR